MIAQCKKLGVELLTKTPVKDVLVEDGKIVGAVAEHEGETFTISCRACILATGSWINNQGILEKANPKYAKIDPGPIVKGGHRSSAYTGDGIALGKEGGRVPGLRQLCAAADGAAGHDARPDHLLP